MAANDAVKHVPAGRLQCGVEVFLRLKGEMSASVLPLLDSSKIRMMLAIDLITQLFCIVSS